MKTLSDDLRAAFLKRGVRACLCWMIKREDGQIFAFTAHDAPLTIDIGDGNGPQTYAPSDAFSPSALEQEVGGAAQNLEATVLTSDLITEADLLAGLFDHAELRLFWVNWDHPEYGIMSHARYHMGQIRTDGAKFQAEMMSLAHHLQYSIVDLFSLTCRANLGDEKCGVNLAGAETTPVTLDSSAASSSFSRATGSFITDGFKVGNEISATGFDATTDAQTYRITDVQALVLTVDPAPADVTGGGDESLQTEGYPGYTNSGTVEAVADRAQFYDSSRAGDAENFYRTGKLTWLTGDNANRSMEVRQFNSGYFALMEPMPRPIQAGDSYSVQAGCDKTCEICAARFSNLINFRGEPLIPGRDEASEYPNAL
ncbi:MAG: DUF2163 domain-containing protein [Magnetospiraceae bacterium]